ncbi:hypothetical protein YT28_20435 [Salmonella enterica subsp. salamae]|nr:hypothetical protein [Salmonella enterica subsp. salamae]EDW4472618.1 hypothetical protein [Salmonella enterica subsp. salamae]
MSFLDSVENFLGMGDTVSEAAAMVTPDASKVASNDLAIQRGADQDEIAQIDADSPGRVVVKSSPLLPDWATKAVGPIMNTIAAAALKPNLQRAPLMSSGGGHGVSASAGSNGQVINQVEGLAGGDPLQGLTGFKNLL